MLPNEVFALACRAYYDEMGLIVDERNGEFAHCPYPEGMGETGYYLLHDHHQHQGILQSKDVGRICFFVGYAKKWLVECDYWPDNYFELWDIFEEYSSEFGRSAMEKLHSQKNEEGKCISSVKGGQTAIRQRVEADPDHQRKLAVHRWVVNPDKSQIKSLTTPEHQRAAARARWEKNPDKTQITQLATQKFFDPDHPEIGHHSAGVLVRKQKALGYPHGKENRVKVG